MRNPLGFAWILWKVDAVNVLRYLHLAAIAQRTAGLGLKSHRRSSSASTCGLSTTTQGRVYLAKLPKLQAIEDHAFAYDVADSQDYLNALVFCQKIETEEGLGWLVAPVAFHDGDWNLGSQVAYEAL